MFRNVQLQVFNALRLFMEMNPRLYERIAHAKKENEEGRLSQWEQVEILARQKLSLQLEDKSPTLRDQGHSPIQLDVTKSSETGR